MSDTLSYLVMLAIILLLCYKLRQHYRDMKEIPTSRNQTMTIALAGIIVSYSLNAGIGLGLIQTTYLTSNGTALITAAFLAVYISAKFFSKEKSAS